jgi:hypothetical protein
MNYMATVIALVEPGRYAIVEARKCASVREAYESGRSMARRALAVPAYANRARTIALFDIHRLDPTARQRVLQRNARWIGTFSVAPRSTP